MLAVLAVGGQRACWLLFCLAVCSLSQLRCNLSALPLSALLLAEALKTAAPLSGVFELVPQPFPFCHAPDNHLNALGRQPTGLWRPWGPLVQWR